MAKLATSCCAIVSLFPFEKSTHFADPNTSLDTKAHLSLKLEGFRVFHSQCKPVEQAYLNAY